MGQRHAFWVIVTGTTATAFRSRYREDLLPTLTQLQRKTPDAVLQWFDRGRLWPSPEAAREALKAERQQSRPRDRDWRPGGIHKDPRARYKMTRDEKRARFKKRAAWSRTKPPTDGDGDRRTENWRPDDRRPDNRRPDNRSQFSGRPPYGDRPRSGDRPPAGNQRRGPEGWRGKPRTDARPGDRRQGKAPFKPDFKPAFKPGGNRPPEDRQHGYRRPHGRPQGGWRPDEERKDRDSGSGAAGKRPWQGRPPRRDDRRRPQPRKKGS
jgi:hypothetical protein